MSLKITSLLVDTLTKAIERPTPVPLARSGGIPLAPTSFPNDWSLQVSLETRWQTDLTRPFTGSRPEKWSLTTKPSRKLRARLVGEGREEAHALLQSVFGYTSLYGVPVPIYPDATAVTGFDPSLGRLFGNFQFRRFFIGGRVAIYPLRISPNKSANSVIWATITELSAESIRVEFDSATTRTPTVLDVVAPCMDVELVQSASGISQIDTLFEVEVEWNELDGACSLPATWPPTSPTNPEILSPFCQIVDSLPVFPFDPDWADGITIEASRDIDSSGSGRSTIQEPLGDAYHRISLNIMGWDRQKCWNVIRFFDSMQGRARNFYLIHPHRPWTFAGIPSLDRVQINAVGDVFKINSHFRRLALFRADGTFITRELNQATNLGSSFLMTLLIDLPDPDFVDVQPVMICSFDQDSLVENWATSEVLPAIELSIREEPVSGPVTVPNMAFLPADPAFLAIPGCNLLLRAGSGCLYSDRSDCMVWPARNSVVNLWQDVSAGPNRALGPTVPIKELARVVSPGTCDLVRFPQQWQNNAQPAIKDPRFQLSYQIDPSIPVESRHLWSSSGWTLFLSFTPEPHTTAPFNRAFIEIRSSDGSNLILYEDSAVGTGAGRARLTVQGPSPAVGQGIVFTEDISTYPYTVFLTIRFETGQKTRIWANGKQSSTSSTSIPLPPFVDYTTSDWFAAFNAGQTTNMSSISNLFGVKGCANLILSYDRPLSIDEINSIHTRISDMYRTSNTPSTLY